MKQTNERRRFTRILFGATVYIRDADAVVTTSLQDISLKGLMVKCPEDWRDTTKELVHIEVHGPDEGFIIKAEAVAMHRDAEHIGFEIKSIDIDSATCLRRLVELNVGDEAILQRELSELCK
ncbi:MAG: PilZ domain-containing protein [Gammaproteobacteria bacterium]|nr:MAG: PilZ domain-containing protein [Gammaproteobacteria bacterium]